MRQTGILMPLSALPSRTGIGELGEFAYRWIEILKNSGVKIWQLLPLNPVGYGNSPYQPYSSCAGDELYISLDLLKEEGLLAVIWPEPFAYEKTQDALKTTQLFPFSEEGKAQVIEWLNASWEEGIYKNETI